MFRPLLLCCCLAASSAHSQTVLSADELPVAGTMYAYHDVPYLRPDAPAGNMRWNYAALPVGVVVPYQWSSTVVAPGAGAFPTGSLVLQIPGEAAQYYLETDTCLLYLGSHSDTELLRFAPPLRAVRFPTSMNTEWNDSGVVAFSMAGRIAILDVRYRVKADAWGTLTMPYGTMNNVLRVRSELELIDPSYPDQPVSTEVRYNWHCDGTIMPLLTIVERSGLNPPDRVMRWMDGSWREGEQSLFRPIRLRVFPDPCVDYATIDLPASSADHTVLQLVNGMGKVVKTWSVEFTRSETRRLTLEMTDVPPDHYTLRWVGSKGNIGSVRLEKQ